MKEIRLAGGLVAIVDEEDYTRVSNHSWCVFRGGGNGNRIYAQANVKIDGQWKRVLMHRFIMNATKGQRIDHRNNDGLDNRRDNLRIATRSQNQHNSGPRRGRFKGVSWHRNAQKWVAQIVANKKYFYLGLFNDEEAAAKAYDIAAKELHGEFAKLNFPN